MEQQHQQITLIDAMSWSLKYFSKATFVFLSFSVSISKTMVVTTNEFALVLSH
jgi:hypothetical protein